MPLLALLAAVTLTSLAPDAAATLPTFSRADEARIVGELCGAVQPGSATTDGLTGKAETVAGYLNPAGLFLYEVILSVSYREGPAVRHLLVLGGHAIEDGEIRGVQAQNTEIDAGLAEWRGGKWVLAAKAPELTTVGQYGHNPAVVLHEIGASRHAFEVSEGYFNQGAVLEHLSLYEPTAAGIQEVLSLNLVADDCVDERKNCFKYEGKLEYPPKSAAATYDLKLTLSGTYRSSKGAVVRVPAAPLVLRLQDDGYAPVGASRADLWRAVTSSPW